MPKAKKTKSGSWKVRVLDHEEIVYDENGKPVRRPDGKVKKKQFFRAFTSTDPSPAGRRAAEKMAADWLDNKDKVGYPMQNMTVMEALKKYIDIKENVLSPSTVQGYKCLLSRSYREVEYKKIDTITTPEIQLWINILSTRVAPKTVRNAYGLFTAAMNMFSPGRHIAATLPAKVRKNIYVPNENDMKALLRAIDGTELEIAVYLGAFGGMRRGEICALESSDVDIENKTVSVNKAMARKNGIYVVKPTPKNDTSYRIIQLPGFVIDRIKDINGRLIPSNPDIISRHFRQTIKDIGVPKFRFHDLRHYTVSIMHAKGVPDQYIMTYGGWKTDNVMKNVYRGIIDTEQQRFAKQMADYFTKLKEHEKDGT